MFDSTTMMPVHDHFSEEPMTGAGGTFALGAILFDGYTHDWRCMGECHRCGGEGGVDVGIGLLACEHCHGTKLCPGCNEYLTYQLREAFEAMIERAMQTTRTAILAGRMTIERREHGPLR